MANDIIEIDRIGSKTQETEFSQIADLFYHILLQDTGEGRNKSNDNPANSAEEAKTSSGDSMRKHTASAATEGINHIIQDGVSNTQNQHRLINSN